MMKTLKFTYSTGNTTSRFNAARQPFVSLCLGASMVFATMLVPAVQAQVPLVEQIDIASQRMDVPALQQHVAQATSDYDAAFAHYRLAITASVQENEAQLKDALSHAVTRLEAALESNALGNNERAEIYALLAAVRGMQAGFAPIKGAYYGMRSDKAINSAKQLAPNNPRVLLVSAILSYQTPSMFGGDVQIARRDVEAALTAFNQPCQQYCWGQAEAYVWRGLMKKSVGDVAGAKADWALALQQAPSYQWPQQLLARR